MILDVGCGDHPHGNVNVDICKGANPQIRRHHKVEMPRRIRNFVLASAEFLPFRSSSFDVVLCSHIIEHVDRPRLLLSELYRVARDRVVVRCPHKYSVNAKAPYHKHYFDVKWFREVLKNLAYDIRLLRIFEILPHEIVVTIFKDTDFSFDKL